MVRMLALVLAGAMLVSGCARYGRHGLTSTWRYETMACQQLDAERGRVEQATTRLVERVRRKGAFDGRTDAEVQNYWPTYIFTRDKGPRDRQRYQQLSMSYEQLRVAARQGNCQLSFAPDVSDTVPAAAGAGG